MRSSFYEPTRAAETANRRSRIVHTTPEGYWLFRAGVPQKPCVSTYAKVTAAIFIHFNAKIKKEDEKDCRIC